MKHKISVIVPVYNAQQYLERCLRSLAAQTIRKRELEVLLVNDGSTDGSQAICKQYTERYRWMRLIDQPNSGPSAARNAGIRQASGRYIMYLDADDHLSVDAVRAVRDFFAAHEDEVDIVTYPLVRHQNGRCQPPHYRYSYISESGVYDCNKYPFFAQGAINVCVRNLGQDNILFVPERYHHEDETYVTAHIAKRWKLGYTTGAQYWYNKDNDSSIMATSFHAYYIFEENTAWFEQMFAAYPQQVPLYLQGLLVNDIEWKLRRDLLFPWHKKGEDFERAVERLRALLRRVDACMLTGHPQMSRQQKLYWLQFAGGHAITAQADEAGVRVAADDNCTVEQARYMAAAVRRKRVLHGKLCFYAYLDTVYFTAMPEAAPVLFAEENGVQRQIPLFESCESFICPKVRTGRVPGFYYEQAVQTLESLRFFIVINGKQLPLELHCGGKASLTLALPKPQKLPQRRIWLYCDAFPGTGANAYLQFQHDCAKQDGVQRYYLLKHAQDEALFPPEQRQQLILRRSLRHILAYMRCEWILTSQPSPAAASPFTHKKLERLALLLGLRCRTVYLQSGVHQFAAPNLLHAESGFADKVVVSTPQEHALFQKTYGYRPAQLLKAGLARYDLLRSGDAPEYKILFAPSWRAYLMHEGKLTPARVQTSEYYKNICALLNDPSLAALLEAYHLVLDVQLHPAFAPLAQALQKDCPRVHVLEKPPVLTRYDACITDISSIAYDFAYIGRYVQYFIPDAVQLRAGMHNKRVPELPQRLGPYAETKEEAIAQLRAAVQNCFAPQRELQPFYTPPEGAREAVYRSIDETEGETT